MTARPQRLGEIEEFVATHRVAVADNQQIARCLMAQIPAAQRQAVRRREGDLFDGLVDLAGPNRA